SPGSVPPTAGRSHEPAAPILFNGSAGRTERGLGHAVSRGGDASGVASANSGGSDSEESFVNRFTLYGHPGTLPVLLPDKRGRMLRTGRRESRPELQAMDGGTRRTASMDMSGRSLRRATALAAVALAALSAAARSSEENAPQPKGVSLGVAASRISDTWRERNNYWSSGVLVVGVAPGGRASQAGIVAGDVLGSVGSPTPPEPRPPGYPGP